MLCWLSFADGTKPQGEQFLGACVVEIDDNDVSEAQANLESGPHVDTYNKKNGPIVVAAVRKAWKLGINPGGQVLCIPFEDSHAADPFPRNKLMTADEIEAYERPTVH